MRTKTIGVLGNVLERRLQKRYRKWFQLVLIVNLLLPYSVTRGFASTFTTIDFPGAGATYPRGINDSGQIVGYYFRTNGNVVTNSNVGFVLDSGVFTTIDFPGASETYAFGINNRRQIVGFIRTEQGNHGFVLDNGVFSMIDFPGASETAAYGINDNGQIVGGYSTNGVSAGIPCQFGSGRHCHGFILDRGIFTTIDVPGTVETFATGINNRGQIVGIFGTNPIEPISFFFDKGVFTKITPLALPSGLSAIASFAYGINDRGQMVGRGIMQGPGHLSFAFVLDTSGQNKIGRDSGKIGFLINVLNLPLTVYGINNRGQVVGGNGQGFVSDID